MANSNLERAAKDVFEAAIREGRCEELMMCLSSDGSATVDRQTGLLVCISGDLLATLSSGVEDRSSTTL